MSPIFDIMKTDSTKWTWERAHVWTRNMSCNPDINELQKIF